MDSAADDGRIRTGTLWTGTAHAFTAAIGSGILALPWSMAQLGWILGPLVLISFAVISYYTAYLFCDCYRTPDPVHGRRNYTYIDAVRSLLGPRSVVFCGILQYVNLWGTMIGYTITTVISFMALKRATCSNKSKCEAPGHVYMMLYGLIEIFISQCPNLEKAALLSIVATVTSFIYTIIVICLSAAKSISASGFHIKGSVMPAQWGNSLATITRVWNVFQALGNVSFAFSYNIILLEIQDTLRSPPAENAVMKKVNMYSIGGSALFYFLVSFTGYAAYGDQVPGDILSAFSDVVWLIDIANICVILHLIGAYQVYAQPVFALHEKWFKATFPTPFLNEIRTIKLRFIHKNYTIEFTFSRLLLRTIFVMLTTLISMMFPFFNSILGLLGAACFWPLMVYFPLTMYSVQANVKRGSLTWIMFQVLEVVCFIVTVVSAVGSVAAIVENRAHTKMFRIDEV